MIGSIDGSWRYFQNETKKFQRSFEIAARWLGIDSVPRHWLPGATALRHGLNKLEFPC